MADEQIVSETETVDDATIAEVGELFGEDSPVEPSVTDEVHEAPPQVPVPGAAAPPPAVEVFDIDGRQVNKEALFQTYRQFSHLQQTHLENKPYLDLMQDIGLTVEQIPQFRSWIAGMMNQATPPDVPSPASALDSQPWFQEIAETFPQYAQYLKSEIEARQAAEARFAKLEETLGGFTGAIQDRQRQEQAVGILSKAADNVNAMMEQFPRLQDPEVRGAFLRWLWDEQQPGAKIADPKFVRGMYMVFDEAALAEQWAAQAHASQETHAATVTRGFAETGAPRAASSSPQLTPHERELAELFSD